MTAPATPEPDDVERAARLAAEAATAGTTEQLADLGRQLEALREDHLRLQALLSALDRPQPAPDGGQLEALREDNLRLQRLLSNFAGQLDTLQQKLDTEREQRIAADARLSENLAADLNLALLERGN